MPFTQVNCITVIWISTGHALFAHIIRAECALRAEDMTKWNGVCMCVFGGISYLGAIGFVLKSHLQRTESPLTVSHNHIIKTVQCATSLTVTSKSNWLINANSKTNQW